MENEKTGVDSSEEQITLFIQKYRIVLFVFLGLICVGIIFSAGFFSIRDSMQKKAIVVVEGFEKRKADMGDIKDAPETPELDALLEEIVAFAPSTFGYAAAKSYFLAADIYASRGKWDLAEEAWALSAKKGAKTHLAPVSLFNAATAAEEQGNPEKALDYYNQSLVFNGIFAGASRARFNIGRIHEKRQDKEAAKEAYRALIEKSSADSSWAKLAQSRIIALELE
jgi:tetratricopeptide (TPR) repeat protein